MHPLLKDIKNLVLDTLFPVYCLGCGQEGLFLCLSCQNQLSRLRDQQCIVCQMASANGLTHRSCQKANLPERLISVFNYHDPLLAQAIIWGKYKFLPDVYRLLALLMIQNLKNYHYHQILNPPMVCPIPLSKERLRWRGFNQSLTIAGEFNREFKWPLTNVLKRIKNTKTQKDLTKIERKNNVSGSFAVTDRNLIQSRHVILIDDVVTTGATLLEAAKVIKLAGASQVWCLTLARD